MEILYATEESNSVVTIKGNAQIGQHVLYWLSLPDILQQVRREIERS